MISILKMAVISPTFLAQVARKGSLVLPIFNTSTTALLSQNRKINKNTNSIPRERA